MTRNSLSISSYYAAFGLVEVSETDTVAAGLGSPFEEAFFDLFAEVAACFSPWKRGYT